MKRFSFFLVAGLVTALVTCAQPGSSINLNQLGFYPFAGKIAVIVNDTAAGQFTVVDSRSRDTVFRGATGPVMQSSNSSTKTRIADFSAYQREGIYEVLIPGKPGSYRFTIGAQVNRSAALAALKGFYFIRSSIPLTPVYAGKWARAAGHPDTIVYIHPSAASKERPAGSVISTPGGWYDAGDYNKYIVNSGITMGTLLSAYEDFPTYFDTLNTQIPESGNTVPDVLDEIVYNLRWMLTMQDPKDGGVYNKCTNAAFDGMVMPGVTKLPRYVVQKGTAATLDFAAVTAQASRIVKKFAGQFPGLSDSCQRASVKAWEWALSNPALEYNQTEINARFDPVISTGGYGDRHFADEWFWAACELQVTTHDTRYDSVIRISIKDSLTLPSWGNVYALGCYTLLRNRQHLPAADTSIVRIVTEKLIRAAEHYRQYINENAFQTVMGQDRRDFNWGSNSNAANQGILLINAYRVTQDKKYIDGALSNLDYILGRNAIDYCFLTGIGTHSTKHPHHRPSVADGIEDPVPGLLAGGPNPGRQDHCSYKLTEPETAYSDSDCSYASNEIAINWNAPLVYLANAIEALQYEVKYSSTPK